MNLESSEKKLHIARNIEGAPNYKEIKMLRELENKLSENESFVGIAPFGSVVSGYSTEESDIDVFVLFDDPGITKIDTLKKQTELWKRETEKSGKKTNILFQNINPDLIIHDIKLGVKLGNPGEFVMTALAEISRIVTGKKISRYRQTIASELHKLTPEQKNKIIDEIIKSLVRREKMSLFKRKTRVPKLSEEHHQKILEERERMWRKRVQEIWD